MNTDVTSTFQDALNAVTLAKPAFLIQTGDITHLSKAEQFDAGSQLLGATGLHAYSVPGEHDILEDDGRSCGC